MEQKLIKLSNQVQVDLICSNCSYHQMWCWSTSSNWAVIKFKPHALMNNIHSGSTSP